LKGYEGEGVLVTGANGFIGSWLAKRLIEGGARVVVPERARPFPLEGLAGRCDLIQLDLPDSAAIRHVILEKNCTRVFHLAARTSASEVMDDPYKGFDVNVRGTYSVLEACRLARSEGLDTRAIVASTYHVYGRQPAVPIKEDAPLLPRNPYEASKACADMVARSYAITHDMPVAVTRMANVYGGGDVTFSRLIPSVARSLVEGNPPIVESDGTQERDYIHVEDAVDAFLAVDAGLERCDTWGRGWNIGSGTSISIANLVRLFAHVSSRKVQPQIRGVPNADAEPDRQYLDSSAIRNELGWEPRKSFDDGLAETYAWYERELRDPPRLGPLGMMAGVAPNFLELLPLVSELPATAC
jgi:CDP-glucose 4,6-dehydratase